MGFNLGIIQYWAKLSIYFIFFLLSGSEGANKVHNSPSCLKCGAGAGAGLPIGAVIAEFCLGTGYAS